MAVLASQDYSAVREPEEAFDAPTELDPLEAQGARHAEAAFEAARLEADVADIVRSAADAGVRAPLWNDLRPPPPPSGN